MYSSLHDTNKGRDVLGVSSLFDLRTLPGCFDHEAFSVLWEDMVHGLCPWASRILGQNRTINHYYIESTGSAGEGPSSGFI